MTLLLFASITPAAGFGSCDTFNIPRFDPNELAHCISEMKSEMQSSMFLKDAQVRLLESQLCTIAMEMREARPSFDPQSYCPRLRPKKQAPKPTARP